MFFVCFPQFYSVFCWSKKSQIVCRGAKIIFWQFLRVCFCLVYVGTSKKDNMKKMEKDNKKKKKQKKLCFLGGCEEFFFGKNVFFIKIGKHYLCSDGKKHTRIFSATICFWKTVLFCGHSK